MSSSSSSEDVSESSSSSSSSSQGSSSNKNGSGSSSSSQGKADSRHSSSASPPEAPDHDSIDDSSSASGGEERRSGGEGNKETQKQKEQEESISSSSSDRRKKRKGDGNGDEKMNGDAGASTPKKRKDISSEPDADPKAPEQKKIKGDEGMEDVQQRSGSGGDRRGDNSKPQTPRPRDNGAAAAAARKEKKSSLLKRFTNKLRGKGGKKEKKPTDGPRHNDGYERVLVNQPSAPIQANSPLYAKCFADLPEDLQKKVTRAKVDLETVDGKNWEVMLNVLRFVTKLNLASDYEHYRQRKRQREARDPAASNLPPEMLKAAEDNGAILRTNPKTIYNKAEFTGKGGFGRVFTCRSRIDKEKMVALKKTPNRTPKEKRMNRDEIAVLHHCNHRNVVQFKRSYMWDQEMALVMEYMEGGSLSEACKKYPFEEGHIALVAREVLNGLSYLHSQNLVHRDMKSANIMMTTKGDVKLIDFGLTVHIDYCHTHMVGSPFWMPPEMIRNEPHGFPADIWSFAVCLIEMADQRPPNRKSRILSLYESGTIGLKPYVDAQEKYSEEFSDFLLRCLIVNPSERATPSELLKHPFIEQAYPKKQLEKALQQVVYSKIIDRTGFGVM